MRKKIKEMTDDEFENAAGAVFAELDVKDRHLDERFERLWNGDIANGKY